VHPGWPQCCTAGAASAELELRPARTHDLRIGRAICSCGLARILLIPCVIASQRLARRGGGSRPRADSLRTRTAAPVRTDRDCPDRDGREYQLGNPPLGCERSRGSSGTEQGSRRRRRAHSTGVQATLRLLRRFVPGMSSIAVAIGCQTAFGAPLKRKQWSANEPLSDVPSTMLCRSREAAQSP
jgi:hypothetical protein